MDKRKSILVTTAVLLVFIFTQSCATIMHGSKQEVGISSNPSKANVSIDGQDRGKTPVVVNLERKNTHMIQLELEGYEPYETSLTKKTSGWVWGNIVFGGLVGLAVDAISGGLYKLNPEQVSAEMKNQDMTADDGEGGIFVKVVLKPDPSWEKIGSLESSK